MRLAFKRSLARDPSPSELSALGDYVRSERSRFVAEPKLAEQVGPRVASGAASEADAARQADAAAWTMLARVLLNLDEFITRE